MTRLLNYFLLILILIFVIMVFLGSCMAEDCQYGMASWYSRASCQKEFGENWDGKTASGEVFDDNRLTCANWDYPFGTLLRVYNMGNAKMVVAEVTDRGPAKRLVKQGRIIDLSKASFEKLAPLSCGIIPVKVEEIK